MLKFLICWLIYSLIAMLATFINDKRENHYIDFGIGWVVSHLVLGFILALISLM